ncbi:prominin-1-like isoform X3 [Saccostrea echinata]|uniref:prominin-1-like isoform X3 n=1 Tax=Saccostrea echinata TaxID=191078 RepID=UPI002A808134|nr:prominin-1-like isoform X3 [Saccostrea echinata]
MKCCVGIVIFLTCFRGGFCADPVLTPETVTDSGGNSANANSTITWGPLPSYDSYTAGSITYDASGLTPLYNFAKAFINGAVFPYGIPWDLMEKAINGTLINDVTTNYMSYLRQFAGYGACVVIGFLFIFIFPLIGLCFCCCRCCCKTCGGKMMQNQEDAKADCKRRTYAIILFILIAFTSAGMICVYLSNDQMSTALNKFDDVVVSNVDDVTTYVSNTVKETKYVMRSNFNFTSSVISRDLDNIGYVLGIPIRTALKTEAKLDTAISSANALVTRVTQIASALTTLNTTLGDVKVKANILSSNLSTLKTDIDAAITNSGCPRTGCPDTTNVAMGFDPNNFPDISGPMSSISSVESQNLSAIIIQAQSEIDNIPERVTNETKNTVSDIKDMVSNFSSEVDPLIEKVESMQDAISTNGTLADIKKQVTDGVNTASSYDKYRWYGGVGLTSIVLLIVLLQLLGLCFGTFSQNSDRLPTDRGCIGTAAGNMLMASVGFVFIFSWLLMLLTTLTFIIGSPLERFVCQPLTDSSLNDLETLVDDKIYKFQYGTSDGYFLGKVLFNNASINLTIKGLLQDCQAGGAAYTALKLNNLFDVTTLTNFTNNLNIESEVDKINIDLSTVQILTPSLLSQLNELKNSINVNFTKFREELSKSASSQNLSTLADELEQFAASCPSATCDAANKLELQSLATRTRSIESNELANLTASLSQLQLDLNSLETTVNGTETDVDNCINNFNESETFIQTNGSAVVKNEAKNFASRILSVVTSFVDDALDALNNDIGKCTPIWNLYNSLFVTSLCKYTIDTLNGFWFALGWCIFFFIPSIIFSTKLAKHYRRMTHLDSNYEDDFDKNGLQLPEVSSRRPVCIGAGSKSYFGSNKVGHHDPSSSLSNPPPYNSDW